MTNGMRSLLFLTCIASTSALGSTLAFAESGQTPDQAQVQTGPRHGRPGARAAKGYLEQLGRQIGVTDEQKSHIKEIFKGFKAQNQPLLATLRTERHQLRSLIRSGNADEGAIRAQSSKVAAAQADLAVARAAMVKQIYAVLKPEQVTKLQTLLDQREKNFEKRHPRHEEWMGEPNLAE